MSVRIYHTPGVKYDAWTLSYYDLGKRRMEKRATLQDAKDRADGILDKLVAQDSSPLGLTAADVLVYRRAQEIGKQIGKSIEHAMSEYAEQLGRMGGKPVSAAVDNWLAQQPKTDRSVSEVVSEFLKIKERDGASKKHLQGLKCYCERFARSFQKPISAIAGVNIDDWLHSLTSNKRGSIGRPVSAGSRNDIRRIICNLMNFAVRRSYLPAGWSEMQRVERATEIRDEVEIFTPEEGQWIMDAAVELDNRMVGYFALALFCGIRHSEIERLHWPDVDLVAKAAFVAKGKVKRAGHRIVPIAPNAVAWLERYGKKHGPVCPVEEMTNRIRVLKNHIRKTHPGFRWVKNGPRHSYVSYRLAVTQNIPQVSEETQSAIGTLRKHYLRPVLKEVGERWFGIGLGGQYPS